MSGRQTPSMTKANDQGELYIRPRDMHIIIQIDVKSIVYSKYICVFSPPYATCVHIPLSLWTITYGIKTIF